MEFPVAKYMAIRSYTALLKEGAVAEKQKILLLENIR